MSFFRWKTAERRIGVIGPLRSGKTVFLTSLINHLNSHNPAVFTFPRNDKPAVITKFRQRKEEIDKGWPWFNYDLHRDRIVARGWPEKTTDRSEYACQFERSDWDFNDVLLKLYDLPGERINDMAMVRKNTDSFDTWSDHVLDRIQNDLSYLEKFRPYLDLLKQEHVDEPVLMRQYNLILAQLRVDFKPFITPSTFLLDLEGKACRGNDPEKMIEGRYSGLGIGQEFAPLPAEARKKHQEITIRFASRFQRYRDEVVRPMVGTLKSCHGLVVMVDVLGILTTGHGMYNDYLMMLRDMLTTLDPKDTTWDKTKRWVSEAILPHEWRPGWISRLAFVAPKVDRIPMTDRDKVRDLLKQMIDLDARNCDGVESRYFTVAAVQGARDLGEGRKMSGSPMYSKDLQRIVAGEEAKFEVSAVPTEWPSRWERGEFYYPDVYPIMSSLINAPLPQVGLANVFNFLCW